jgi:sulfur-carrier protein
MKIKIRLFTKLAEYVPEREPGKTFEFDLPESGSVASLITRLHIPAEEAKIIMVNGRAKPPEYVLDENDEVAIFPPIGGG